MELSKRRIGLMPLFLLVGIIVVIAVVLNILFGGKFLTILNINAIATSAMIASFTAWGYAFVFALNYVDLSIGAVIVLVIYASGELGNRLGALGVILGGLVAGIVLMMINFNIFAWTKIPSWIAGLGMLMIYEAIAAKYAQIMQTKGEVVVLLKDQYSVFGHAPGMYFVFGVGIIIANVVYNRSSLGLNLRSVGSNPAVAKAMGVSIVKTVILTGLMCGFFVGCAGFMRESYALRVFPMTGLMSLSVIFPPLATLFLAQVLSKWINLIIAIPFCSLFVYMCYNVLAIIGVPSGTLQEACLGLLVLIFGVLAQRGVKGVVK